MAKDSRTGLLSRETVERLRQQYKKGATVELVEMNDIQAPPVGTKGKVTFVDDAGTIHVSWETGSSLGIVYGEDKCKLI